MSERTPAAEALRDAPSEVVNPKKGETARDRARRNQRLLAWLDAHADGVRPTLAELEAERAERNRWARAARRMRVIPYRDLHPRTRVGGAQ